MKTKCFAASLGLAVLAAGCVGTMEGKKTAGMPFLKDRIEGRYERPATEVFNAAKAVIAFNGALIYETTLHNQTNAVDNIARVAEGKVRQCRVWAKVEQLDPRVSAVTVQARTGSGGADIYLAAELEKQIALKLVR
jgi:hypothetical protein